MAGENNFPVGTASISWTDSSGGVHIRVYSTDGYNVIERAIDSGGSGWYTTDFAASGSQVSATVYQADGGAHLRVYCTTDDATTEWCQDNGGPWTQGSFSTV